MRPFENQQMHAALRRLRQRLLIRAGLRALAAALLLGALMRISGFPAATAAGLGLFAGTIALLAQYLAGRGRWPTLMSLVEHLNRSFPLFEESAQLLLSGTRETGPVKDIQRRRVEAAWELCIQRREAWLPPIRAGMPLTLIAVALMAIVLARPLDEWWTRQISGAPVPGDSTGMLPSPALLSARIRVIPPAYTGLPEALSERPNIEVAQGSRIEWALEFNRGGEFELELSDGEKLRLEQGQDGRYRASALIESNQLYRISFLGNHDARLIDVHSIAVTLDRAPEARIIDPPATTLEIAADGPARFESTVLIADDYGIDRAEILASVAKGSGEGVKFRDETLSFDSATLSDDGVIYRRFWDLERLGMEPGDELYFFANAFDNRQPQANRGRSETIVVRWLDEGETVASADGIAVDLMPDYFKSQRQIIIETEELIADRGRLERDRFDALSRALGQDQGSLKLRYGQYLGDETEGFGPAPAMAEGDSGHTEEDVEESEHGDEAEGHESHEHTTAGAGSAEALIEQFTHDHEAAEIGPVTQRNPVGLMKRALSNMWQAELHLLLSEPERALPFEREALKYLNMARQAERIYTQRLGFEPPPVTEDRRLSGALDEIETYLHTDQGYPAVDDDALFSQVFELLSIGDPLDEQALSQVRQAGARLAQLAHERPGLLEQAALLERWVASNDNPEICARCREDLARLFWSLVKQPNPPPGPGNRVLSPADPMVRDYRQARIPTTLAPDGDLR